jgi:hypothetical protein
VKLGLVDNCAHRRPLNHLVTTGAASALAGAATGDVAAGAFFAAFLWAFFALLAGFTSAFGASTLAAGVATTGAATTGAALTSTFGASAAIATEANNAETSITIDLFMILIPFYKVYLRNCSVASIARLLDKVNN